MCFSSVRGNSLSMLMPLSMLMTKCNSFVIFACHFFSSGKQFGAFLSKQSNKMVILKQFVVLHLVDVIKAPKNAFFWLKHLFLGLVHYFLILCMKLGLNKHIKSNRTHFFRSIFIILKNSVNVVFMDQKSTFLQNYSLNFSEVLGDWRRWKNA